MAQQREEGEGRAEERQARRGPERVERGLPPGGPRVALAEHQHHLEDHDAREDGPRDAVLVAAEHDEHDEQARLDRLGRHRHTRA